MKFRNAIRVAVILCPLLLCGWIHGLPPTQNSPAQSGIVIAGDYTSWPFVNLHKIANRLTSNSATSFIYPNFLLQGSNLPSGTLTGNIQYSHRIRTNYFGKYVEAVSGTITSGSGVSFTTGPGQVYSVSGATLSGCNNGNTPPCYFANGLSFTGTNPIVTFDFSAPISGAANNGSGLVRLTIPTSTQFSNAQAITVTGVVGSDGNGCGANGTFTLSGVTATTVDLAGSSFPGGCTYSSGGQLFPFQNSGGYSVTYQYSSGSAFSGMTSDVMCRQADYNADNTCKTTAGKTAWPGGFNDDYITAVATLGIHHFRDLDVNNAVFNIPADYNGWETESAFSYNVTNGFWAMTNWFGSTSGTNAYSVTCVAPCTYTLNSGAPRDGDFFHFYNVNANTLASNTTTTASLAVTDINSVTSSAIPLFQEGPAHLFVRIGGTITANDTVALQFNTTALGAYTCLAGGTHTTSAYTVAGGDTVSTIANALNGIVSADATLKANPQVITSGNAGLPAGVFSVDFANNACTVTVAPVITGGTPTETVAIGNVDQGKLAAQTLYTGVYSARLGGIIVNTTNQGGQSAAWPWIVQIDLAKALTTKTNFKIACWLQVNVNWSNASFTSLANLENSNQCPGGAIYELGNEIWNSANFITAQAASLGSSVGFGANSYTTYNALRSRELWGLGKTVYGSIGAHFQPTQMFQVGSISNNAELGTLLCGQSGCANGNQAYDRAIGVNYNASPNRPADFLYAVGQAPYHWGSIFAGGNNPGNYHSSSASYATWSATCSVTSNVLTCGAPSSGTILWNQGISACGGAYIAPSDPTNPQNAQLTGTVTTTLNGAVARNTATWTLTTTAGLSTGMWVYNSTTGFYGSTIASINAGANQITLATPGGITIFPSSGSNDTIVFGGAAGTYRLNSTSCSAGSGTVTGGDVLGLQYAADNYCSASGLCSTGNSGLGSVQDAYNWMYQDVWSATNGNVMLTGQTVQSQVDNYNIITSTANLYSQKVFDYEDSYAGVYPSTGQATAIGLPSSSYGGGTGYLAILQTAWKNNVSFKNMEIARHNLELTKLPAGGQTMWFEFRGTTAYPWALYPNDLYFPPAFQSYNAICDYNGGSC